MVEIANGELVAEKSFDLFNFINFSVRTTLRQNCEFCLGYFPHIPSLSLGFPFGNPHSHPIQAQDMFIIHLPIFDDASVVPAFSLIILPLSAIQISHPVVPGILKCNFPPVH